MRRVKASEKWEKQEGERVLFIAGSIEMGKAEDWQNRLCEMLEDIENLLILDPRREHWDSSWEQTVENPHFVEQVTWELDGIDASDIVSFYFDPETKSPVTLLETGIVAGANYDSVVCCPPDFFRRGNVEIVCKRKNIPLVETLEDLSQKIHELLNEEKLDFKHMI